MRFAPLVVVSLMMVACGGGKEPPPMVIGQPDAAVDAPRPCLAEASYGTPTPMDEIGVRDLDVNPTEIYYEGALNADAKYDSLSIQLFKGFGAYEAGEIVPGVIALQGAENNYETCGACVLVYVDIDPNNEYADEGIYMVDGGTLNIMSIEPTFKGRISNANFTHVTIDPDTFRSTPVGDCASSIMTYDFDFALTTDSGMAFTSSAIGKGRLRR